MIKEYNYFELFREALFEKGLKITDLEENEIFAKNSFYNLKRSCPNLETSIKFANFVGMSLDYILGRTSENKFRKYKFPQLNLFKNLTDVVDSMKLSKRKLTEELDFSSGNTSRWKNGTTPLFSNIIDISDCLHCNIDDLLQTE